MSVPCGRPPSVLALTERVAAVADVVAYCVRPSLLLFATPPRGYVCAVVPLSAEWAGPALRLLAHLKYGCRVVHNRSGDAGSSPGAVVGSCPIVDGCGSILGDYWPLDGNSCAGRNKSARVYAETAVQDSGVARITNSA